MRVVGHWNREQLGHMCFILEIFEDRVGWDSENLIYWKISLLQHGDWTR